MLVQRVITPGSQAESWTVLGDDDVPIDAIETYLAFLSAIERSPNTVKAYAHDLKDYFAFLTCRELDWQRVALEDIGRFVEWLGMPPAGRTGRSSYYLSVPHMSGRQPSTGNSLQ